MSTHINAASKDDIAETILLPGDPLRAKFIAENYLRDVKQYNNVRGMLGFTGIYKNIPVSVQGSGMGMPSMGIYSWELITEYGCKNLIRIGTSGALNSEIMIRDIIVSLASSTDSNYAHSFKIPGSYSPAASWELLTKLYETGKKTGISFKAGNTVSCDVFYETDPDWWKKWSEMGVLAVEMEAAALYMNAAYHGVNALAVTTVSDHFITGEHATIEKREKDFTQMMKLALELAVSV